jgi:hypothetical protein
MTIWIYEVVEEMENKTTIFVDLKNEQKARAAKALP